MEERTKLFAIIISTYKGAIAVIVDFTISLSFRAGIPRCTAWSWRKIPSLAFFVYFGCRNWIWLDTTVILLMEERTKLFAIIVSTDKISSTVVIDFTISFSFRAGILRCTARSWRKVPSPASLTCLRLRYDWNDVLRIVIQDWRHHQGPRSLLTTVILLVVVGSKLLTVVASTY